MALTGDYQESFIANNATYSLQSFIKHNSNLRYTKESKKSKNITLTEVT